jgi:hypothetical protein
MVIFARTVGIDYSGAETPTASLKGLRVYLAGGDGPPEEVPPPPSPRKYRTRKGIAVWLVERLGKDLLTLVGTPTPSCTLSPRDYDAVLFDLDGVLTRTASVHAAAWKRLFDEFLKKRSADTGEPFVPFDIDTDYRRHVDGKPRYDGVTAFLGSRGIELPQGAGEDEPNVQSVRALGILKDKYFFGTPRAARCRAL